ncbi:unnamed protein product [Pieris macdunnoughi]|uniref:EF-hand domain-containing protein n=1 Tax=Pieris macdunnoughi TaxID=345717 RepID=A0A821XKI6_9NEOP|nr:unnamed protein product [Pieris macdunnoughi]
MMMVRSLLNFVKKKGKLDKNHKVYTDKQLENLLETALTHTDLNNDGYIDYLEYRISNYKAQAKNVGGQPR